MADSPLQYQDIFTSVNSALKSTTVDQNIEPPVPDSVRSFLGHLSFLKGVPLYYLLPDERLIPQESLRSFLLDKDWIGCLLNGAVSLADDESKTSLMDQASNGQFAAEVFYNDAKDAVKKQIYGLYGPQDHMNNLAAGITAKTFQSGAPVPTTSQAVWTYSGFFLRSTIVSAWVGVEITARGKDDLDDGDDKVHDLQVIRFERIASDTILCFCKGIVTEVVIVQPKEGIHFSVEEVKSPIPYRTVDYHNVVDVTSLAKTLSSGDSVGLAGNLLYHHQIVTLDIKWSQENS